MKKINSKGFDYVNENLIFKIRKVMRYIKLYGISRTIIKVKGQYHMQKKFKDYPSYNISNHSKKNIAIVGCGNFAYSNIAYYLRKNFGDVIRVSMDKNIDRAASLFKDFNAYFLKNLGTAVPSRYSALYARGYIVKVIAGFHPSVSNRVK